MFEPWTLNVKRKRQGLVLWFAISSRAGKLASMLPFSGFQAMHVCILWFCHAQLEISLPSITDLNSNSPSVDLSGKLNYLQTPVFKTDMCWQTPALHWHQPCTDTSPALTRYEIEHKILCPTAGRAEHTKFWWNNLLYIIICNHNM
jgi:hypothetical protein